MNSSLVIAAPQPIQRTDCMYGWTIQDEKGQTAITTPTIFNDLEMDIRQIIRQRNGNGLFVVDMEEVNRWGLRFGDKVIYRASHTAVGWRIHILAVWDVSNPDWSRNRNTYSQIMRGWDVNYSGLPVDLDVPELYGLQLVVPVPLGGQLMLSGEAGAGKSTLNLMIQEALMAAASKYQFLRPVFIFWHIGERNVDKNAIKPILDRYPDAEFFHFGPPRGVAGEHENRNTILYVMSLVERLFEMGRHVIICGDGLRGLVLDTFGPLAPADKQGLTGSGVSTYGIRQSVRFMAHAGFISAEAGSITNIVTTLAAAAGGKGQAEQIRQELGLPEATGVVFVAKMNGGFPTTGSGLLAPKVYVPGCDLRKPNVLFRDQPERLELHFLIRGWLESMYKLDRNGIVTNGAEVLATLNEFARTDAPTFKQAVPGWLHKLKTTKHFMTVVRDHRWDDLAKAAFPLSRAPYDVKEDALRAMAKQWGVEVYFEKDMKEMSDLPMPASQPTASAHAEPEVPPTEVTEVREVSEPSDGMATYEEILAKWQFLVGAKVVKGRGKFNHKAKELAETLTLVEFEQRARSGEWG